MTDTTWIDRKSVMSHTHRTFLWIVAQSHTGGIHRFKQNHLTVGHLTHHLPHLEADPVSSSTHRLALLRSIGSSEAIAFLPNS